MNNKDEFSLERVMVTLSEESRLMCEKSLTTPEDIVKELSTRIFSKVSKEEVAIINFNNLLQPINFSIVSIGTVNKSIASVAEIIKPALLSNANTVMLLHNHPSGSLKPSVDDVKTTEKVINAFDAFDIKVLDHLIIPGGDDTKYYSMRENAVVDFDSHGLRLTGELKFTDINEILTSKIQTFYIAEDLQYFINSKFMIDITLPEAEAVISSLDDANLHLCIKDIESEKFELADENGGEEIVNLTDVIYKISDINYNGLIDVYGRLNNPDNFLEYELLHEKYETLLERNRTISELFEKTYLGQTFDFANITEFEENPPLLNYQDAFFMDDKAKEITWIYFNPDSVSGGQFVTNVVSYNAIFEFKGSKTPEEFFEHLNEFATQTLTDVNTEEFAEKEKEFLNSPDLTDLTEATQEKLVKHVVDKIRQDAKNTPQNYATGTKIHTPIGEISLLDCRREDMEKMGYGFAFRYKSGFGEYEIMDNGKRAYAVKVMVPNKEKTR